MTHAGCGRVVVHPVVFCSLPVCVRGIAAQLAHAVSGKMVVSVSMQQGLRHGAAPAAVLALALLP